MLRVKLSEQLKCHKEFHNYTYDFLAEETGLSKTSIRCAMNGGEGVGFNVFETLIEFFDLEVDISTKDCLYFQS